MITRTLEEAREKQPLRLEFLGALVEELGAQMYPGVTASVAELISNAWDADAKHVWVAIPLGTAVGHDSTEIVVLDDGHGMNRQDAQRKYLQVGQEAQGHG